MFSEFSFSTFRVILKIMTEETSLRHRVRPENPVFMRSTRYFKRNFVEKNTGNTDKINVSHTLNPMLVAGLEG